MSQDRKAKLKKREEKQRRALERKRELFDGALAHAGLTAAFERCQAQVQEALQQAILPIPEMVLDPSANGMPDALAIQRRFGELLEKLPKAGEADVTPLDFFCVLWALKARIEGTEKGMRERGQNMHAEPWAGLFAFGNELLKDIERHKLEALGHFLVELWSEILVHSVVDDRVFWYEFQYDPTPGKKIFQRYVLKVMKPERTRITCDGAARPAFRASIFGPRGLSHLTWTAADLGFDGAPQEYPVYVQSHALEQLARRVPSFHTPAIVCSLTRPKFTRQSEDSFLVEYRQGSADHKLGYFVGVRLPDKVLLKTFLFLTMQGTPESDLLYSKLRLTRRDIEFIRLDELSVFLDQDVRQDAGLVKLFDECGCGHLLKAADPDFGSEGRHGHAEQLRKYLGNVDRFISRFAPRAVS